MISREWRLALRQNTTTTLSDEPTFERNVVFFDC